MENRKFCSASLTADDLAHVWHPFTQAKTEMPPIPIVKGKGAHLYSAQGKRYIDAISSWWVNLHGHAHPYIAEKIAIQAKALEHVLFANFTHPPAIALAARLLPLLPGKMSKVFHTDNGSTAVEAAVKMALQYEYNQNSKTQKTRVVCFKNGYHGDTFGAMSAAGKNGFNRPFWKHLFHTDAIDLPYDSEKSLSQLKTLLAREQTACFIFEPLIQGSGGMRIYPPEGLNALLKECRKNNVITIADEVMTGFGRTGTLFACEQLVTESPDIICLSKGLTGGFLPLGATACTEKIFRGFLSDSTEQAFLHGHSYTANPLACASALASLDLLLDPNCLTQRQQIAENHARFCAQVQGHSQLVRCETLGTILALEYVTEGRGSYFHPLSKKLLRYFLDVGVIVRPLGNVLYIMPPYCIEKEDLEYIYRHIEFTLENPL